MKKIDKQNLIWVVVLLNLLLTIVALGLIVTYILNPRTSNEAMLNHYDKYTHEIEVYMDDRNKEVYEQVDKVLVEDRKQYDRLVEDNDRKLNEIRDIVDKSL